MNCYAKWNCVDILQVIGIFSSYVYFYFSVIFCYIGQTKRQTEDIYSQALQVKFKLWSYTIKSSSEVDSEFGKFSEFRFFAQYVDMI